MSNGWDTFSDPVIRMCLREGRYKRTLPDAPYDEARGSIKAEIWGRKAATLRMCRWCGSSDFAPGRRSLCSAQCAKELGVRQNPTYARMLVKRRDKYHCVLCVEAGSIQVDHIVPVIEGGGSCGIDNLRTLCQRCHDKETAALAKRRADQRREGVR